MKRLFVTVSSTAMLLAGMNLAPLNAQEEVKGPVPKQSDANNPASEVYRASDVMNMPVKNDEGNEIGRIKDLVINGESREVLYAVVAMNDAKQKDSLYVMPWSVFQPSYGQGNAFQYTLMNLPPAVWMQAPFYSPAQWRQATFSQWGPRVNSYYANHIPAGTANNARSNAVRAAKPNLNDDNAKDSTSPKAKSGTPVKNGEKPAAKEESDKPSVQPKKKPVSETTDAAKTDVKEVETPAAKSPKLPSPKDPDPAGPKIPTPAPRDPKVPAPAPK